MFLCQIGLLAPFSPKFYEMEEHSGNMLGLQQKHTLAGAWIMLLSEGFACL